MALFKLAKSIFQWMRTTKIDRASAFVQSVFKDNLEKKTGTS